MNTVIVVMSPTNAKAGTTDYPTQRERKTHTEWCANPPNMDNYNQLNRTYDRNTIDTLQNACDYVDQMNDELNAYGHDINRCESHKINTNEYVCMFDGIVQITIQNNQSGIGIQMWLCQSCFDQIHAQWKAKNPNGKYGVE